MPPSAPLRLRPVLLDKVWGGDRLGALGFDVRAGARVGEAWVMADLDQTSASGAGGGAVRSLVADGPAAGRTLREALGGDAPVPVLAKFLDAREHLSVQVHPSAQYAAGHPDAHFKTECWYIIAAEPGATLFLGVEPGVTAADLRAAAASGRLVDHLRRVPAVPGDCHLLPSGLIHALGAGVLVAEVQTPSDTTFRLYDWTKEYGRPPRAMHLDEALAACDLSLGAVSVRRDPRAPRARMCTTEYFTVDAVRTDDGAALEIEGDARLRALMVLGGAGAVRRGESATPIRAGDTLVLPPGAPGAPVALTGGAGLDALVVTLAGARSAE